jgi:hypothetical protein
MDSCSQRDDWESFKEYHPDLVDSVFEDDKFDDEQPKVSVVSVLAIEDSGFGRFGDYELVGHGSVANVYCGKFMCYRGCPRADLHDIIASDGKNYKGKVFVRKVHHYCNKPSCPVCFKHGWAVREAGKIEGRLTEASKRFGQIEHIVCSIPSCDYGLSFENLRLKAVKVLFGCGVVGGVLIFHGFRYNRKKYWYWSPHFHVLGFILGGYARCRHCKGADCHVCDGFEGRVIRCYRDNDYIVKALGERKTVFGTAWYQLNHSTIKHGVKRFHVATWFGVCSYRKLKVSVEHRRRVCPICEHDLVNLRYNGNRFVLDDNLASGKREFFADAVDSDGRPVWIKVGSSRGG